MTYWCQRVIDAIGRLGPGGFVVDFASYRPDLVQDMAAALQCAHVDFRRLVMAPLGSNAHTVPLTAIEATIAGQANERGIVLHNAEALLATRSASDRRSFVEGFLAAPRSNVVVLPMALFGREIADHERIVRLTQEDLPTESLLVQLASMRFQ
ncbi:MAG TPA: hypothetical protein PLQ11_01960 [Beijerinckiaceae bacterium]|nr:hypothetical protein [Beijerinckiaceae bacterium]